jgi:AcrR family transcriptional regulator
MTRPSRNLDRLLLAAGRALLPEVGCAGLTIRRVADAAGVNIGMFHYHFKTREAFLRAVLQQSYEEMFSRFSAEAGRADARADPLRLALRVLGRFLRDNRRFIARVLADALAGDTVARDFMKANMSRHLGVLLALIADGQRRGTLLPMPPPQALGFCGGSIALPILAGGAFADSGALTRASARGLENSLLTDEAIDQRIDLALAALAGAGRVSAKGRARR